jgi:tetratricopeptide (TPR) repeat protein
VPIIGFILAGAGILSKIEWDRVGDLTQSLMVVSAVLMIGALSVATWQQNTVWENPIRFYTNILKFEQGSARMHNNLAMAYAEQNQDDLAMEHYQFALKKWDIYPQTHHNIAGLYLQRGDVDAAIKHLKRALELNKNFFKSAVILQQIYLQLNDQAQADFYDSMLREIRARSPY